MLFSCLTESLLLDFVFVSCLTTSLLLMVSFYLLDWIVTADCLFVVASLNR